MKWIYHARDSKLHGEYLSFIRNYIDENRCAPRLEEIARYFNVTEPTAHKMLSTLAKKGSLIFGRDPIAGFYIKIVDWVGTNTGFLEIMIIGALDRYGFLYKKFPKNLGHFTIVQPYNDTDGLFALEAWQQIPQADIIAGDLLIFDQKQEPQIDNICIISTHNDWLVVRLVSQDEDEGFFWSPWAYDETTKDKFTEYFEKIEVILNPMPKDSILASAIAMKRVLAL